MNFERELCDASTHKKVGERTHFTLSRIDHEIVKAGRSVDPRGIIQRLANQIHAQSKNNNHSQLQPNIIMR